MKIEVNKKLVKVFVGSRVKHAIRKYSIKDYKEVKKGRKLIRDKHGHKVMLDGELIGEEELFIEDSSNSQSNP
ncbi:MAG: hypothetical protein V5A79_04000 [Candidatus Bipolaricaulota bacterium]